MRITERQLKKVIRQVIKENYDSVPTETGIYTDSNKHVEGNLWDLLSCNKDDVVDECLRTGLCNEEQATIIADKIVFGNYGPEYGFQAGIYFGGYDWNSGSNIEDSKLNSREAQSLVNSIIDNLGLRSKYKSLVAEYSGDSQYQEFASQLPPKGNSGNAISQSQTQGRFVAHYALGKEELKKVKTFIKEKIGGLDISIALFELSTFNKFNSLNIFLDGQNISIKAYGNAPDMAKQDAEQFIAMTPIADLVNTSRTFAELKDGIGREPDATFGTGMQQQFENFKIRNNKMKITERQIRKAIRKVIKEKR